MIEARIGRRFYDDWIRHRSVSESVANMTLSARIWTATSLVVLFTIAGCTRSQTGALRSAAEVADEQAKLVEARQEAEGGAYENALAMFHQILEENPTSGEAYLGIGDVYLDQQDYVRAEPALARAAKLEPRNYDAQFNHGVALQMLDRFLDAIRAYHRALTIDPDSLEANRNLAASYLHLEEPRNAIPFAQRAVSLAPDDGPTWISLGAAYEGLEDWPLAADAYVAASERMEPTAELMGNLLRVLVQQKRYAEVVSTAETLQRFGPDAAAWERAGWAWFRLGDFGKSLDAYGRAVAIDPSLWQAWNGVGVNQLNAWLLSEQADQAAFAGSGEAFRSSLRVNGDQPKVLTLMLKYKL